MGLLVATAAGVGTGIGLLTEKFRPKADGVSGGGGNQDGGGSGGTGDAGNTGGSTGGGSTAGGGTTVQTVYHTVTRTIREDSGSGWAALVGLVLVLLLIGALVVAMDGSDGPNAPDARSWAPEYGLGDPQWLPE